MSGILETCTFRVLTKDLLEACHPFDCGNDDLNEFFQEDCIPFADVLLGKSYCFTLDKDPEIIVCAFTISNDSIKASFLPNARKGKVTKRIPREKQFRTYPAVLIGRLGVNKNFARQNIGCDLMDFIKAWFVNGNNKTGCRYIVVDSYNEDGPRKYYHRCEFEDMFNSPEQENSYLGKKGEHLNDPLKTRLMYFDLIILKPTPN